MGKIPAFKMKTHNAIITLIPENLTTGKRKPEKELFGTFSGSAAIEVKCYFLRPCCRSPLMVFCHFSAN
jgi:hypothetical protein